MNGIVGGRHLRRPVTQYTAADQRAVMGASPYTPNQQLSDKLEFVYLQSKISADAYTIAIKPCFFDISRNKFSII